MRSPLLKAFVVLVAVYAALVAAWPILRRPSAAVFDVTGNVTLALLGFDGSTFPRPPAAGEQFNDTAIQIISRGRPQFIKTIAVSGRALGYLPAAVFLALLAATPVSRKRKLIALPLGLLLLQVYAALSLAVSIEYELSVDANLAGIWVMAPWQRTVLAFLSHQVATALTACFYVIPIFVWIVVLLRRRDAVILRRYSRPPMTDFARQ